MKDKRHFRSSYLVYAYLAYHKVLNLKHILQYFFFFLLLFLLLRQTSVFIPRSLTRHFLRRVTHPSCALSQCDLRPFAPELVDTCQQSCRRLDCISLYLPPDLQTFLDSEGDFSFPPAPEPVFSVVLLTHNHAYETYKTLVALHSEFLVAAKSGIIAELIIVDNYSSEWDLRELHSRLRNVAIYAVSYNSGWAHANNVAVKCAAPSSQKFLFLNNDAIPQPGFISEFVNAFSTTNEERPIYTSVGSVFPRIGKVGAVGCKIVFDSGTLQEAGSIAFWNGITAGYGRNNPFPDADPRFNFRRLVDFVSGACLAVRKSLFYELQGFDETSFPSYYEDTDLCMRLRYRLGYDTLYIPSAWVRHHESLSFGRSEAVRIMTASSVTFAKKWQQELQLHHMQYGQALDSYCSRDRRSGLRILALDDAIHDPGQGAGYGRARMLHLTIASLGHMLTVLPVLYGSDSQLTELSDAGIEVAFLHGKSGIEMIKWIGLDRPDGFDIVIISRPNTFNASFSYLKDSFPSAFFIYDAEALWSRREKMAINFVKSRQNGDDFRLVHGWEMAALESDGVDRFSVVSSPEKRFLLDMTQRIRNDNVFVVGHMVKTYQPEVLPHSRKYITFLGAFHGSTNYNGDAVLYFVQNTVPLLRQSFAPQDSPIVIAGFHPPQEVLALASANSFIFVKSDVLDLDIFFSEALMLVIPHQYAAGIPMKAYDAAARGVPVIISIASNSGLGASDEDGFLIASTPNEIVQAISTLLNKTTWQFWSHRALDFAKRNDEASFTRNVASLIDVSRRVCLSE